MRWWAFWRRVQYGAAFCAVLGLLSIGAYYLYFYQAPTCFDQAENGDEKGVDCGGSCERVCSFEIIKPTVLWADAFKIMDGQYNLVAYVENRNTKIGSPALPYTFQLFDAQGLITEVKGVTVFPPDSVYPIFEGKILTGSRTPTRTTITFSEESITWMPGEVGREQFTLENRELTNADSKPQLTALIKNNSLNEAQDVEIIATIFDASRRPLTVARTFVDIFSPRTTERVTFTWPLPIAKSLRSCEIPTDVLLAIDLSGSMNDDGGIPPEPVSSVLSAAQTFITRLNTQDQIGLVTYATGANLVAGLTADSARVRDMVKVLTIDPKEERGSTNTGDALMRMREEFASTRHSPDARKVAILLTDGLATAPKDNPEIYAEKEATLLKNEGVTVFTIGLGAKVNAQFLKNMASSESQYFEAPSVGDLGNIYSTITESICEDGIAIIEVIPKAKSSFKPLE